MPLYQAMYSTTARLAPDRVGQARVETIIRVNSSFHHTAGAALRQRSSVWTDGSSPGRYLQQMDSGCLPDAERASCWIAVIAKRLQHG